MSLSTNHNRDTRHAGPAYSGQWGTYLVSTAFSISALILVLWQFDLITPSWGLITMIMSTTLMFIFWIGVHAVLRNKKAESGATMNPDGKILRVLIDNIPDNIYVKDKHLRYTMVNQSIVNMLRRPMLEIVGKSAQDLQNSNISFPDADRQVLDSGIPTINKEDLVVIDGQKRWFQTIRIPILDAAGTSTGIIGVARDITALKKLEEAMRLNSYHIEKAQAVAHIGHWISTDSENESELVCSKETHRIFGLTGKDFDGKFESLIKWVHPDDFNSVMTAIQLNGEKSFSIDHRIILPNGAIRWVHQQAELTMGLEGKMVRVGIVQDITERKLAEEELKSSQRNLNTVVNNTENLIWLIDKDLRLILANKAFEDFSMSRRNRKIPLGEIILIDTIGQDEEYTKWYSRYQRVLTGEQVVAEEQVKNTDGKILYSEIILNPVYDEPQNVVGISCFSRDITDRKYIEEKLKYFIDQYDIVSMATNDAIWDWYLDTDTIVWNHGLKTIFGYEEKDITYSLNWRSENIHVDDRETFQTEIENTFKNQRTNFSLTYRFRCSNGVFKYVFDRAYVIYEHDKPRRMIGAIQDIDDRMGNLDEVKKLSLVASKTENAVAITDKNLQIEWINNSFTRLTGYRLKEVIGRKPFDFLQGPDTDQEVIARIEESLRKGESITEELINYSKTGNRYFIRIEITPIHNDSGELEKFITVQSDITRQKEFEKHITSIAQELANLIEYANTPIFGVDNRGSINEWNKVTADITGYGKNEVLGKKLLEEFIEPSIWPVVGDHLQKIFQGNSVGNFEVPIYTKNNERLTFLLNATPRRNTSMEIIGALIVGQDITELIEYRQNLEKKVEERTRALNESLQKEKELAEMKNKFVSMVSHEFRTPLSSISLASGFIKKYQTKITKEEAAAKLDNIEKQVRHMTFLLNDILTIGKSEAGKIQAQVSPLPLTQFLQNLVRDVEHSTAGGTHKIELTMQCPEIIYSDEKLLRNIIINLLTNAIKFSPNQALVTLDVTSSEGKLFIKTKDMGIGIAPEDLPNIFTAFHRGNNVGVVQGTGLGLSITKKAIDLLQGDIEVQSDIGKGTLFIVTLPLKHDEENSAG